MRKSSIFKFFTGKGKNQPVVPVNKGQPKGQGQSEGPGTQNIGKPVPHSRSSSRGSSRQNSKSFNPTALPSATSNEESSDSDSNNDSDSDSDDESSANIEADQEKKSINLLKRASALLRTQSNIQELEKGLQKVKKSLGTRSRGSTKGPNSKSVTSTRKRKTSEERAIDAAAKAEFAELKKEAAAAKKAEAAAKKEEAKSAKQAAAAKKEEAAKAAAAKKGSKNSQSSQGSKARRATTKGSVSNNSAASNSSASNSSASRGSASKRTRKAAQSKAAPSKAAPSKGSSKGPAKASGKVSIIDHYARIFNFSTYDEAYPELMRGFTIFNQSNENKSNTDARVTIISQMVTTPKTSKEMCEYVYDLIKHNKFREIPYYNESMTKINEFGTVNITTEMNELFQTLNDTFNSAKKSVKLYGSDIQFRNDNTGAPITNMVKIIERKGWNGAQMIQRQIEDSLGLQQEKAHTNDEITIEHLNTLQKKMTPILKYIITELIKTNLHFNMYNTLFELFEKYYNKYVKETTNEGNESNKDVNELKLKLIDSRAELLKIIERYKLIKQIAKGFIEIKPVKYFESIIEKIDFKDKKTKEYEINKNEMVVLHKGELQNKSSALNMKIVTSQIYNVKSIFSLVFNLIKDYNKKENPTLSNYLYGSL
jgi:hypothetical protein